MKKKCLYIEELMIYYLYVIDGFILLLYINDGLLKTSNIFMII